MTDVKLGECYLSLYLNRCRNRKKALQGLTIVFSTSGVFGWKFWEYYAALACCVIAAIQLLAVLSDQIVRSDKDLQKIAKLRSCYTKYMIKLEKLWTQLESETLEDGDANVKFFKMKGKLGRKIQDLDNGIQINGNLRRLYKRAEKESNKYLINRYGKA